MEQESAPPKGARKNDGRLQTQLVDARAANGRPGSHTMWESEREKKIGQDVYAYINIFPPRKTDGIGCRSGLASKTRQPYRVRFQLGMHYIKLALTFRFWSCFVCTDYACLPVLLVAWFGFIAASDTKFILKHL
jgi:hypothetical protein